MKGPFLSNIYRETRKTRAGVFLACRAFWLAFLLYCCPIYKGLAVIYDLISRPNGSQLRLVARFSR